MKAHAAANPGDNGFGQAIGFILVPFTVGYTKPCYRGSRRAWEAIKAAAAAM